MQRKLLFFLAASALLTLAPLHASAQQPLNPQQNVAYVGKVYTPPPGAPAAAGGPVVYNYNLVVWYNGKSCIVAQGNSQQNMANPPAAAPAVVIPQQLLQNLWLNVSDPQWLPWLSPPPAIMQQIQAM